MKKLLCFLSAAAVFVSCASAENPDVSETVSAEKSGAVFNIFHKIKKKKPKKYHKKWKKDKAQMPVLYDDYLEKASDKKRSDYDIPSPVFEKDKDFILPEPEYKLVKYNIPHGARNIDLSRLVTSHTAVSPAVLSLDKAKMIYTKCFYYPQKLQSASAAYFIPVNGISAYNILYNTNVVQGEAEPLFTAGMDNLSRNQFVTLFPLDFSKDSSKIAFKEKTGSNLDGVWITNIIIYDFEKKTFNRLEKARETVIEYALKEYGIKLQDYLWDIQPIGWYRADKNRIIYYAYIYTDKKPAFLGLWSIDFSGLKPELISPEPIEADIDVNGFGLERTNKY